MCKVLHPGLVRASSAREMMEVMKMEGQQIFHEGAMVKCGGCNEPVHASQNTGAPERAFRCDACRVRDLGRLRHLTEWHEENTAREKEKGQSDDNFQDKPASSGSARKRGSQTQPQPVERALDDK
jgi:hypothetical protein